MAERAGSVSGGDHVFLGRGREIGILTTCLDEVLAGQGAVVTISGPAGIGKTRLAQEFAAIAVRQGMTVLHSYCHEEPAAPAYWPWTRLMERYLDCAEESALEAITDEDRAYLATLVMGFREPIEPAHPVSPRDLRQPRFALFDAVSRLWLDAARRTPKLLFIDDLHWCDESSLKLLEFLVQDIESAPLMLVLTYRDDELVRRHPLSDTLGEIARRVSLHRIPLHGLEFSDSALLIRTFTDGVATADWVAMLHERSEGNPLFLLELVRYFTRDDDTAGEKWTRDALTVPDGVRTIIGKRLNRLSPACERMLGVAAVVGRTFPPSLIAKLQESMTEEALWDALDEARAAHVIEVVQNESDTQQFTHTLIRETLYEEMLPARRQHLHLRCGDLLEKQHGSVNGTHLPQLAYHFASAVPLGDVMRAIELAERAAQNASAQLAYEEAARLYRIALDLVTARPEPEGGVDHQAKAHHCEIMLALGDAQARAGEGLQALQIYRTASERASELGLARIAANAAIGYEEVSWRPGLSGVVAVSLLERALVALSPPVAENGPLVAQVLSALSRAQGFCGNEAVSDQLQAEAIALARSHGDAHTLMMALRTGVSDRWRPDRIGARLRAAEEALALAKSADDTLQQTVDVLGWYLFDLFEIGDMVRIEHEMVRYGRLVETLREPFYRYVHDTVRAGLAFHRGNFAEFEALVESIYELGTRLQGHEAEGPYGLQMFSLRREQGQLAAIAPMFHWSECTWCMADWKSLTVDRQLAAVLQ